MGIWWPEVEVNKANFGKLKAGGIERTEEGELPQGRGERAWLPNSTARSPRAVLTSEKAHLQAIRQSTPGWTAAKKAHVQWKQQVARRTTRIAQVVQRLDRVGEIEEVVGIFAERKIEELAKRKLRFDWPDLAQEWDKIHPVPTIESTQCLGWDLGRSLTLFNTADKE